MASQASQVMKRRRLNSPEYQGENRVSYSQPCLPESSSSHSNLFYVPPSSEVQLISNGLVVPSDEIVCFGTIPSIAGRCDRFSSGNTQFMVDIESSERFVSANDTRLNGLILPCFRSLIQGLLNEKTLRLFASCTADSGPIPQRSNVSFGQVPCALEITVHGPIELLDEIGEWFQDYQVYLQDPRICHLDVRYCNPQRLSSEDVASCPFVSQIVSRSSSQLHFQDIIEQPDLLDIISAQDDLEETVPPRAIRAILHRHQKQALTFMLQREMGWDLKGGDMWEAFDSSFERVYINRVTDAHQSELPQRFCGGIIADPMGLGKTLTMIALAATDLDRAEVDENPWDDPDDQRCPVHATLIIVPQPLLGTWEEQISDHVWHGTMPYCRHHGKTRLNSLHDIEAVRIVLTTYHTLAADWKTRNSTGDHIIFSVRWKRIILDEAHLIRNMKTRMARALCDLEACSRWAVTGTPIQNHLSDLAGLLKFVRAHPYDDPKQFDSDLTHLWKAGEDEEAVKRLKRLSRVLILRRAKKAISLPVRRDVKCPVEFNKAERELYENIRQQTITKIEDALLHETDLSRSGFFVNFLQRIESMRLICNLGLQYHARHDLIPSQEATNWAANAQEAFNIHREMNSIFCSQCSFSLDITGGLFDEVQAKESPLFSRCLKYACADCSSKLHSAGHKMPCGHTPRCPTAPISIHNSAFEEAFGQGAEQRRAQFCSSGLPSKVATLIADLQALPLDVKSIVFSTWRLTLNIIETGLHQAGIRSVRFDGKVSQAQRQPVLNQFRSDPSIRVILLTLQCGAVGLTLTEASRAYLMEPHWNPTIEEQALARIHRIGQTREVTTVRFYIRDSFEERVMEVQESKKNLAGVLLSGHDGGQADDSLGALQRLRSLL